MHGQKNMERVWVPDNTAETLNVDQSQNGPTWAYEIHFPYSLRPIYLGFLLLAVDGTLRQLLFFCLFHLFKQPLHQHGAWTHNTEVKSRMFYQLGQPGAPRQCSLSKQNTKLWRMYEFQWVPADYKDLVVLTQTGGGSSANHTNSCSFTRTTPVLLHTFSVTEQSERECAYFVFSIV